MLCSDIMLEMKSDPKYNELYSSIKQNLRNVLKVMIHKNILNDNDNDSLSTVTWQKINDMFPRMKTELFEQNVNHKDYPHPTSTPYSRIEQEPKINEKYIK